MELILSPLTGRLIRGACFVVAVLVGAVSIYFTISQGSKPLFDHIGKMGPTPTAKTTAR